MSAEPDPVDLTERISRRERRRTRALSAALVLALFAGPTLGFVAGQSSDDGVSATAESADTDPSASTSTAMPPDTSVPDVVESPATTAPPNLNGAPTTVTGTVPSPGRETFDFESARADVVAVVVTAYANDEPDAARTAMIDDPTGLPQIWEQNRRGPFGDQIAETRVIIDDVLFASEIRAVVEYHFDSGDYGSYGSSYGDVQQVEGSWKVTRAMICADIALSGAACPPPG